jgi:hypothetical protein
MPHELNVATLVPCVDRVVALASGAFRIWI